MVDSLFWCWWFSTATLKRTSNLETISLDNALRVVALQLADLKCTLAHPHYVEWNCTGEDFAIGELITPFTEY